jgi:thimet oligopeptidase
MSKPLCPCCFQAYASAILADQPSATADEDPAVNFKFCGTCAPSDVELALAKKGEKDQSVPPVVWFLTVEEIKVQTQKILDDTKANLDAIAALPLDQVTFENTVAKLMTPPNYKTNPAVAACKFLQHCSTDPVIREAASMAGKAFGASRVQGRMRKDVYQRVKAFSETEESQALSDFQKHFVKASLEDFERAGLALSEEDGKKLQDLLEEDAAVCSEYGKNLGADSTKLFFTPEELQGCGDDFIKERLGKDEEGKCTITLKYPDIIPIGSNCEVSETRRMVTEAREGVNAYKNNLELVAKGIGLRKEIASLLRYTSWAEYICSKRMSGSYKAVDDFLSSLESQVKESGAVDFKTILDLKKVHCEETKTEFDGKLNAWDSGFYTNHLLKTKYGVDAEKIREYFPLDHVVETTLNIYQEILGLTFTELSKGTYWSWHKEVRCFDVKDTESSERIGFFYLDLHPREGKYGELIRVIHTRMRCVFSNAPVCFVGHAAIFHLVKHGLNGIKAVDCMLCNLPASTSDKPSLLRHQNVVVSA